MKKSNLKGFTLVELMVAIALGLLIVAAATQLFITGQVSLNLQKAMADIQDNSNFGINFIASDLRKANYGADQPIINSTTKNGGIVLSTDNFPNDLAGKPRVTLLSKAAVEEASSALTSTASDQLVVQYYTPENTIDCEGNNVLAGNFIVQRYFIDSGNLKCDSGQYLKDKPTVTVTYALTGFGSNAQTILKNVEYMRILLAVSEDNDTATGSQSNLPVDGLAQKNLRYIGIGDYPATGSLPRIRGVQLGILMKANESVSSTTELVNKNKAAFRVLDTDVTLKTKDTRFLHQVVTQTIALRNAMGAAS